jgi:glycerol uptake facilitator-like aquaporin
MGDIRGALRGHWPEYLMEAAGLGLFMLSACAFTVLLYHPVSPVERAVESQVMRRVLMGLAMALTAVAIIYSPWGRRSGAHLNPAVTLTFWRLGKVAGWDAAFYIIAQFVGGLAPASLEQTIPSRYCDTSASRPPTAFHRASASRTAAIGGPAFGRAITAS